MNKKIIPIFLILILFFTVGAIHASENGTDILTDDAQINQTELISPTKNTYPQGQYSVYLIDSSSNLTVSNQDVNFEINKVNYTSKTDSNGVASINLLNLKPGKYTANINFTGNTNYTSSYLTSVFNVLPTIKSSNVNKYYKANTPFTATFYDNSGNVLKKTNVEITVNGKLYKKTTNNKGVISLNLNLKPGTYKVVSVNPRTGYSVTNTFKVLSTITASSINKVSGDSKKFTAKFLKNNGKALAGKYIKFKVNKKTYKVKTNTNGNAKLSLKNLKPGTYKIICYNTDGLTKKYTIKVYKIATTKLTAKSYTFLPNNKREMKVQLTTNLDASDSAGKVIKLKINGKTYSKKTDSQGIVYFDLTSFKKGIYDAQYTFEGNKYFKKSQSTKTVKIYDSTVTKLTVKSTKSFGYGANTLFKVEYSAGGVPLTDKNVKITVNGKEYNKTTDKNGIASIPITLKIGNYTVDYKTQSEKNFNGTDGSCNITVFERSPCKLTWKCGSSYKDSLQTFKILLTDLNGKTISGEKIELIIDGETYTGKTDSKGYATIKTAVAIGKYNVKVKFTGSNNYKPNSTSHSINVELSKFGKGLNEKNGKSSSIYLKSSSYCKIGTKQLKALVKSLTKGLTNNVDKAKAIFNYVRDEIEYSYYYNSQKGASGTLKSKKGNCVDKAHLLVALYRTAGFPSKYVHGRCTFSTMRTGHVWTQVLVDNTWICADPVSYRNSLGKIANWNTKTYTYQGKYASLPF